MFQDAREDCEDALAFGSDLLDAYVLLARTLESLNLHEDCQRVCEAGLKLDSRSSDLLVLKRESLAKQQSDGYRKDHDEVKDGIEFMKHISSINHQKGKADKSEIEKVPFNRIPVVIRAQNICLQAHRKKFDNHQTIESAHLWKKAADLGSAEGLYNYVLLQLFLMFPLLSLTSSLTNLFPHLIRHNLCRKA